MTVTGGSALSKDAIDEMVKEAERYAEDDKKRREAVELRNEADSLAFRTEKLLDENGDKISEDVKTPVTESLEKLKEALKGTDNTDEVKAAMEDLNTKASAMGQAMYAAAQAEQQAAQAGEGAPADQGQPEGDAGSDDDVVDAEIVDEDKPKDA